MFAADSAAPLDLRPRILIVDDVRSNQQVLAELLKDDYRIHVASSGSRALEIVNKYPDMALILLDVVMPEMDGYEVCNQLKSTKASMHIPVIFITSANDDASERYGLQLGAVDYITKPVKPQITKLRVRNNIAIRMFQDKLNLSAEIIENSTESIIITNTHKQIIDVNPSFSKITGYSRDEVIGKQPHLLNPTLQHTQGDAGIWDCIESHGHWSGELWNQRKNGEVYPERTTILAIRNQSDIVTHYVGIASDITDVKQRENQLERLAHFDALTGIPNRALFADRMKQAISVSKREQKLLGVCYLDLDGFKPVNDSLGHQAGDCVLVEIANRISQIIRAGDSVARLGGDEFAVLLVGFDNHEHLQSSINRILAVIRRPILIQNKSCLLGASIGITIFPNDNEDPDTLLRHADHAMYIAKQSGKNCYHIYDPELDSEFRHQNQLQKRIQLALERHEFELYYQPKMQMSTGQIMGIEALIRWNHPEQGLLLPKEFIPVIEQDELIVALGDWVIESAFSQLQQWFAAGYQLPISINIADKQLLHSQFMPKLRTQLAQYPALPSHLIELELLETSALEIGQCAQIMADIERQLGIIFALDDFGIGYSSLMYLKALPIKVLKIDQNFVLGMLENKADQTIIKGIISLAKAFRLKTIAEGVETQQHFDMLLDLGCEIAQGYHVAHPMTASAMTHWLNHKQAYTA